MEGGEGRLPGDEWVEWNRGVVDASKNPGMRLRMGAKVPFGGRRTLPSL